jgi:superfamily II helicase
MPRTSSKKSLADSIEIDNYPGKIGRTDRKNWVKVCPNCFSPNVKPLTNISGPIVQEQWICAECNYVGLAIEVKVEDLIRFQVQKLALLFNKNQKVATKKKD